MYKYIIIFVLGFFFGVIFLSYIHPQQMDVSSPFVLSSGHVVTGTVFASGAQKIETHVSKAIQKILDDSEVQKTLYRIEQNRPRYRQDGAIFMNREKRLPFHEDKNYYREWTVETPGSHDRGPRRIIVGKGGEIYFTDDHYRSFMRVR